MYGLLENRFGGVFGSLLGRAWPVFEMPLGRFWAAEVLGRFRIAFGTSLGFCCCFRGFSVHSWVVAGLFLNCFQVVFGSSFRFGSFLNCWLPGWVGRFQVVFLDLIWVVFGRARAGFARFLGRFHVVFGAFFGRCEDRFWVVFGSFLGRFRIVFRSFSKHFC